MYGRALFRRSPAVVCNYSRFSTRASGDGFLKSLVSNFQKENSKLTEENSKLTEQLTETTKQLTEVSVKAKENELLKMRAEDGKRRAEDDLSEEITKHALTEARYGAIFSNRVLLEVCLRRWAYKKFMDAQGTANREPKIPPKFVLSQSITAFVEERVVIDDGKGKKLNLEGWPVEVRDHILKNNLGDSTIISEFGVLMHKLSTKFHHLPGGSPGLYIGGEEPLRTALSILAYHFTRAGFFDEEVTIVDRNLVKEFTLLHGNVV